MDMDTEEEQQELIVLPDEFAQFHPRTTPDKKWVSAFDILSAIGYSNATREWGHISSGHQVELAQHLSYFKFPGPGQRDTPCINALGVVKLLTSWLPSSPLTKTFRDKAAEVVVRYLGGDLTLIGEVRAIREGRAALPEEHPAHFFGNANEVQQQLTPAEAERQKVETMKLAISVAKDAADLLTQFTTGGVLEARDNILLKDYVRNVVAPNSSLLFTEDQAAPAPTAVRFLMPV